MKTKVLALSMLMISLAASGAYAQSTAPAAS